MHITEHRHVPRSGRLSRFRLHRPRQSWRCAQIIKLFVRPEGRGKGAGTRLLATALDAIEQSKFQKVNLVTIAFMKDAISL
ncbi:GNAT family N-acetyltransferase [Rhizobium sp. T1473]|uniref:GNAT family N-acetyltransferase n=1 Tax=unclassified Rhizobium TaxID=2613769 RepID=UPI001CD1DFC1|nr:GNAT family N-acetyltransferase [Rhizobium sp. T1473]